MLYTAVARLAERAVHNGDADHASKQNIIQTCSICEILIGYRAVKRYVLRDLVIIKEVKVGKIIKLECPFVNL